ncbi:tripartite tricarboxylate transporter substrate binding protein [Xylophilus sp. GW821-FHT01B05]
MPRRFKRLLLLAFATASLSPVLAQVPYPQKPIRIIASSAVGGLLDAHARLYALKMSEKLGQPVTVENRPGANGALAYSAVRGAERDGYTLLATSDTIAIRAARQRDPGYDLEKDFTGIGLFSRAPVVLLTGNGQRERNFSELAARARTAPDTLTYASSGEGTTTHLAAALLLQQASVRMLHVPYKGNAAAKPDVIGGRVNVMLGVLQDLGAGNMRALGVSATKRVPAYPDIPTLAEQGAADFSWYPWFGLVAPSGVPKDVVQRLAQAMQYAAQSDDIRRYMEREGSELVAMSPEQFTASMRETRLRIERLAADLDWPKE